MSALRSPCHRDGQRPWVARALLAIALMLAGCSPGTLGTDAHPRDVALGAEGGNVDMNGKAPDGARTKDAVRTTGQDTGVRQKCSRFHPGHYVRVVDSADRKLDGLAALDSLLSKDVRLFQGVVDQIDWAMLEPSKGVYDFSRTDAALAKVKATGKYLVLKVMDRTFWTGCNSTFLPAYVAKESDGGSSYCVAKIWEPATMDDMIRVLQQVQMRYKTDPHFLGLSLEETSMAPLSFKANWNLGYEQYKQLKRMHNAVHSVAPQLIINQYLNHPVFTNIQEFYAIGDNLIALGEGGGIGWPDTTPAQQYDMAKAGSWYQVARDRRTKLLIMAGTEGGGNPDSSYATTEKVYNMLVDDIKAHAIVWDTWAPGPGDYFTTVVVPLLNKYAGQVGSTVCPW